MKKPKRKKHARKPKKKYKHKHKKKSIPRKPSYNHRIEIENGYMLVDEDWRYAQAFTYTNTKLFNAFFVLCCSLVFALLFFNAYISFKLEESGQAISLLGTVIVCSVIVTFVVPAPHKFFRCLPWLYQGHLAAQKGYIQLTLNGKSHHLVSQDIKKYSFSNNSGGGWNIRIHLLNGNTIKLFLSDVLTEQTDDVSRVAYVIAGALPSYFKKVDKTAWLLSEKTRWLVHGFSVICVVGISYYFDIDEMALFLIGVSILFPHLTYYLMRTYAEGNVARVYVNTDPERDARR